MSAFDLRLAEILASRLCHDLVNPIGAVSNGVELLAEFCDTMQKDALDLVATSAERAMKRIAFFRVAYGAAGHDEGQGIQDVRPLVEGLLAGGRVRLDWPAKPENDAVGLPRSGLKLLLCLVALGAESLPRGGTLTVSVDPPSGGRVVAAGPSARLDASAEAMLTALRGGGEPDAAGLDPKNVAAAYAGRLAQQIGAEIVVEIEAEKVGLALTFA